MFAAVRKWMGGSTVINKQKSKLAPSTAKKCQLYVLSGSAVRLLHTRIWPAGLFPRQAICSVAYRKKVKKEVLS